MVRAGGVASRLSWKGAMRNRGGHRQAGDQRCAARIYPSDNPIMPDQQARITQQGAIGHG